MFLEPFQSQDVMSFAPTPTPSQDSPPPLQSQPLQNTSPPSIQSDPRTADVSLDSTYQNSSFGFKMNYPSDWSVQEIDYDPSDPITDIVTFTSPFESPQDTFTENLIVSSQKISDNSMTAEKFADEVFSILPDAQLVDKNTTTINISGNDYPAYTLVYSQDIIDDEYPRVISAEKGIIVDDMAYIFQYPGNDQSTFPVYLPIVQQMIDSFELTSPTGN
jgi:hypothetical protein